MAAPDLWVSREEPTKRETMTIQQRCTLSFSFPPALTGFSDAQERASYVSRVLQLPVANTLFQNGRTSTLLAQRWKSLPERVLPTRYSLIDHTWLSQQKLQMIDLFSNESTELQASLCSHLHPITPTRIITTAVGNIVQKISVDDSLLEIAPASQELERNIASAISSGQIPAQQAGIWALVNPPNHGLSDESNLVNPNGVQKEISQAVLKGCQLHKVLSGGGGWGEKQGLLSLDPDCDYTMSSQDFEASLEDDVEPEKFETLAKPGDTVQFYIYKSPSISEPLSDNLPDQEYSQIVQRLSIMFGSIPSTMDAMPDVSTAEVQKNIKPQCDVIENQFGMLSEEGMSLEVRSPIITFLWLC